MMTELSHSRILTLLDLLESHEREQRPFTIDVIHDDAATAWAELRELDRQSLANLTARTDDMGALRARLTPFGRSTLSLVRGDQTKSLPDAKATRDAG